MGWKVNLLIMHSIKSVLANDQLRSKYVHTWSVGTIMKFSLVFTRNELIFWLIL